MKKYKNTIVFSIKNKYFTNGLNKKFTNIDLDCFDLHARVKNDKRSNSQYFYEYLCNYNMICYAFLKKSLLVPQNIRIYVLFLYIYYYSFFNAIFFFDSMIENRISRGLEVIYHNLEFICFYIY
jgi:hypothetical protein